MSALVELYRFVELGATERVLTFTNADRAITYSGETYLPVPIFRSQVEVKNELSKANLTVTFDLLNEDARRWMASYLEAIVILTIFERDEDDEISVVWKGRLSGVKSTTSEIVLNFESLFTSLRRPGLRARYQRACRHVLYGRGCFLNKDDFAIVGTVTAVSNEVVTVPEAASYADGYFTGGMIEGPDGALRFITAHIGQNLTLIRPLEGINKGFVNDGYGKSYGMYYGGLGCRIFPGCPRDRNTCHNRFNNLPNYGGFPFIPLRNPFDGSSIV